jgi:hypothetical protein
MKVDLRGRTTPPVKRIVVAAPPRRGRAKNMTTRRTSTPWEAAMRVLLIPAVPAVFIVPLLAAPAAAQEHCKWSSGGESGTVTSYPQQLNLDVGDTPGHIVGVYELHSVAGPNAKPNCEGLKDKETWTHAYRDYRNRNGHAWGYSVTTLENGDKIYSEISGTTETTTADDGSTKTTYEGVANWTGGTGRYQTVRGIERDHVLVDWAKGESKPTGIHSSADGEYWFEK